MPRIQIVLPKEFLYKTEISVRVSDLNYGGHVGHDTVLTLMQEARITYYRSMGFKDETSIEGNVGQIIADAAVQYKAESFLGDILVIEIGVLDISKFGFDMLYRVTNKATDKEIAFAKTGIVCFDYTTRKIAAVPLSLLNKIQTR